MTKIAIFPVSSEGKTAYMALAGDKQYFGKTAGEALDALTIGQMSTVIIVQHMQADQLLSTDQWEKLSRLMTEWHLVKNQGSSLTIQERSELEALVNIESFSSIEPTSSIQSEPLLQGDDLNSLLCPADPDSSKDVENRNTDSVTESVDNQSEFETGKINLWREKPPINLKLPKLSFQKDERLRSLYGSATSGSFGDANNESIDADLVAEYANNHEDEQIDDPVLPLGIDKLCVNLKLPELSFEKDERIRSLYGSAYSKISQDTDEKNITVNLVTHCSEGDAKSL